ncbi:MAG TPA: DoxX family protein [Thermoanaerobaculia bacterium]|nr:DoxX family protein [Thermoanaerobaculia bacterium]
MLSFSVRFIIHSILTMQPIDLLGGDVKLVFVFRLLLGGVLGAAGIGKLFGRADFEKVLRDRFGLRPPGARAVALGLPWTELVLGIALVLGLWIRYAAGLSLALLLIFSVFLLRANALGHWWLDCGCFGSRSGRGERTSLLLLRNILLMAPGILLLLQEGRGSAFGPEEVATALAALGLCLVLALSRGVGRVKDIRRRFVGLGMMAPR